MGYTLGKDMPESPIDIHASDPYVAPVIDHMTSPLYDTINADIKDGIFSILQKHDIRIDEETLIRILRQDATRYREAYKQGYCDAVRKISGPLQTLLEGIKQMNPQSTEEE